MMLRGSFSASDANFGVEVQSRKMKGAENRQAASVEDVNVGIKKT